MRGLGLLFAAAAFGQRAQLPEFTAGDQCLFCHRNDIGQTWQKNRHGLTVRPKPDIADAWVLGSRGHQRELRKTGYGKFAIREADGSWNETKFAQRCAGCHSTAVDRKTGAFAEPGIDCYACHGVVNLEHSNDTSLILLSKKNRGSVATINSICGSCHLRGGSSKTTGLPFPYHFVPGDDLFADWRGAVGEASNPGDRHTWDSVKQEISCLSCHQVHTGSSARHRRVLTSSICNDCHLPEGPKKNVRPYTVTSALCEY